MGVCHEFILKVWAALSRLYVFKYKSASRLLVYIVITKQQPKMENFKMHVKCECQQRGCKHCDPLNKISIHDFYAPANNIPVFDFSNPPPFNPEPGFDKMFKDLEQRMESPYFYCIELENSAGTYLSKAGNLTRSVYAAERFFGKDGQVLAKLYLKLNQDAGTLKDFIVTEHKFT